MRGTVFQNQACGIVAGAVIRCRIIRCGVGIVIESWGGADGIGVGVPGKHIDPYAVQLQAAVD